MGELSGEMPPPQNGGHESIISGRVILGAAGMALFLGMAVRELAKQRQTEQDPTLPLPPPPGSEL